MINSIFIYNILDLLLDSEEVESNAKKQKGYLMEGSYEYTTAGLLTFSHMPEINNYKIQADTLVLNGVAIKSNDMEAEAMLFFSKGLIDYLEIWSKAGSYPLNELKKYELIQEWKGSSGRKVVVT